MREYVIPPDDKEEEKIFGAIFTLRQVVWMAIGLLLGILMVVLLSLVFNKKVGAILGFPFCFSGVPVALIKKNGLSLDRYLLLRFKHKKKTHRLLFRGGL